MVFVSLKDQQILYADGLSHAPPNNLAEAVLGALRDIFHQDISSWDHRAQRLECPDQGDGHSCGIVVLCEMMYRLTASPNRRYDKSQTKTLRISWLRAILEYSSESPYSEWQHSSPSTVDPTPNFITGSALNPESFDISNLDQSIPAIEHIVPIPALEEMAQQRITPSKGCTANNGERRSFLDRMAPPRPRKVDPLPYAVAGEESERRCELCPPFNYQLKMQDLFMKEVCSYACAKRFVVEVLAKPHGFTVTHGKVRGDKDVIIRPFDVDDAEGMATTYMELIIVVKYRKLGLYCHLGRTPKRRDTEGVVPEGRRESRSKRQRCPWRVNISWPPSMPTPYISWVFPQHNHEVSYGEQAKEDIRYSGI